MTYEYTSVQNLIFKRAILITNAVKKDKEQL